MSRALPPIPWAHSTSDFGSIWQWETSAFLVTVNGDQKSVYYQIADRMVDAKNPKPFADGQASSFEQAERAIRETIGKAYPASMGFQQYAGNLATTFMLGNGQRVDLGLYVGRRVTAKVASREGQTEEYTGVASVKHYDFVLTEGEEAIKITPSYILEIKTHGGNPIQPPVAASSPTSGRTFQGKVSPGCTGIAGFIPGTVEHYKGACPIHEDTRNAFI